MRGAKWSTDCTALHCTTLHCNQRFRDNSVCLRRLAPCARSHLIAAAHVVDGHNLVMSVFVGKGGWGWIGRQQSQRSVARARPAGARGLACLLRTGRL